MLRHLLLVFCLLPLASPASEKPNIVLFFVDDLGWTDVGFRSDRFETPNIDALAKDGISFEQAYVASPTCSPSRSTLVTGQHTARIRMVRHIPKAVEHSKEFNLLPTDPAQFPSRNWLPLEHTTYAEALGELGYYNLFVGKWHLGHEEFHPVHQGFDRQIGTSNDGAPKSYYPPYFRGELPILKNVKPDQYLTDRLTDDTIDFIGLHDKELPFMISLWYYAVHKPHVAHEDYLDASEAKGLSEDDAKYATMIRAVDESVGRIRKTLEDRGIAENAVIIFTSDQGSWFENPPYRGSKRVDTLGEGGARVPFFIAWPGVTPTDAQNQSLVQTTDLFPTLVEIAGGNPLDYENLDGVSLLPILAENKTLDRGTPLFGYRAYQDLYVSVREGPWKLLGYRSGKSELYHVEDDRFEKNDLTEQHPEKAKELISKLIEWEKEMQVEEFSGFQ
ncbi:MAG: sulfatase [Verrucomicrobiota bacterium]